MASAVTSAVTAAMLLLSITKPLSEHVGAACAVGCVPVVVVASCSFCCSHCWYLIFCMADAVLVGVADGCAVKICYVFKVE